jgi:molecular chaperone HtpG
MISYAECQAIKATKRGPFAVNLEDMRNTVEEILGQVGRFGFFNQYTPHSIKHVDEMLRTLDWVIPETTKSLMSPADWFLIVTAIYFHDLGLLITTDEFDRRDDSGFRIFCDQKLFSGDKGEDYRQQLSGMSDQEQQKFLYQEFVRANHGRRVRAWIEGSPDSELGAALPAIKIVDGLLHNLDGLVRKDLAGICESHTLNDLSDFKKYPVERPYANSRDDTANVHYCAILLRTVDLLQITSDRAPSTLLKLINPADPISQTEWAKQQAVKMIRPKARRRPPNPLSEPAPPLDTIEVFANFSDENGYFGLTSYLSYAERELENSTKLSRLAADEFGSAHEFHWRHIDTSHVEADNFLKEQYEFRIDQSKILDLLTGHTIYNNNLVVIRELVQNSLDAIRLQRYLLAGDVPSYKGEIQILWDPSARTLEVRDNGTGMSQATIENHLLKVGSSKYQDSDFKKNFPGFAPISRFGIGVLTAFMVADSLEIMTSEKEDSQVRQISLRSLHGKYLIRLFDKRSLVQDNLFSPHGTSVRLKLRRAVEASDLQAALRNWIVVPECRVIFRVTDQAPVVIGYQNSSEALSAFLEGIGLNRTGTKERFEVRQKRRNGFDIAYAVKWSDVFHEWEFARLDQSELSEMVSALPPFSCICVQGVAVEFTTPGFRSRSLLAIANATGPSAPRTNVARTALETTHESAALCEFAYEVFRKAIEDEVVRLRHYEGLTLTRAINEIPFLLGILARDTAQDTPALAREIGKMEVCIVEGLPDKPGRAPLTIAELQALGGFWTVESEAVRSAESLLGQFASDSSIHAAVESLSNKKVTLPRPLLCNLRSLGIFQRDLFTSFELSLVRALTDQQRLDFGWKVRDDRSCINVADKLDNMAALKDSRLREYLRSSVGRHNPSGRSGQKLWLGLDTLTVEGLESYGSVRAYGHNLILPGQPIVAFLSDFLTDPNDQAGSVSAYLYVHLIGLSCNLGDRGQPGTDEIDRRLQRLEGELPVGQLKKRAEFVEAMAASTLTCFDPLAWQQRSIGLLNQEW